MSFADDLDMLGAEGLSGQYITLRVKSIDKQKLGQALGGGAKAAAVPAALAAVDFAPQQVLSLLMPVVQEKVRVGYGVDLEYQVTDAPPPPGEKKSSSKGSGTAAKVLVGVVLGVAGAWAASHYGAPAAGRDLMHRVGL